LKNETPVSTRRPNWKIGAVIVTAVVIVAGVSIAVYITQDSPPCVQTGIHGTLFVRVVADATNKPVSGADVSATITDYCNSPYPVSMGLTNSTGYSSAWYWTGNFEVSVAYGGATYVFPAQTSAGVLLATLNIPSGVVVEATIACHALCVSSYNTTTVTAS
jgi:hypothetical protein